MPSAADQRDAAFDLRRIDLNLVLPLHALLEEQSVSAAARRLGVTQPAASQSLAKLRKHFSDELLERDGRRYRLTPLAARLQTRVDQLVKELGSTLSPATPFDPCEIGREFVLLASDYAAAVLGGRLSARLAATAPRARLRLRGLPDAGATNLQELFPTIDGMIAPQGMTPPGNLIQLFADTWCCIVDEGLADEAASWSVDDFASRGWVATEVRETIPARDYLRHGGVEFEVVIRLPTFTAVPYVVGGTPYVGVLHRRLAEQLAPVTGTAIIRAPWQEPSVHMVMFYDALRAQDPAVRWFVDEVAAVAAGLDG